MAVSAVSDLSDRVQDYTLDALTQALGVPLTRVITTTAPLTGGGALSSDLTLAVSTFSDVASGIVPLSGGGTSNFLRADGTWSAGTVSGVPANRLITTTAPLRIDGAAAEDLSTDRTLSVNQFTSISAGTVPASGGGAVNYMRADGTWASPFGGATGPFVHLDALHPGTTDTGNAHITGWLEAEAVYTNSSALSTRGGANLGAVQLEAKSPYDGLSVESYGTLLVPGALNFRRGRGTSATPLQVASGDIIGSISVDATPQTTSSHSPGHAIVFFAEAPQANDVPWDVRIKSGRTTDTNSYFHWLTQNGQVFGQNLATVPTPTADFEIRGSFALKPTLVTSATYQLGEHDTVLICDATINDIVITIPWNSSARGGRFLWVKRTDTTVAHAVTVNSFVGAMDNGTSVYLYANEAVLLYGDGVTAWRVLSQERWRITQATPNSALANTVTDTAISDGMYHLVGTGKRVGTRVKIVAGGKFSTTGTPTLLLRVAGSSDLHNSGALTTASSVTNADWRVECEFVYEAGALGTYQVRYAGAYTFLSNGSGVQTRYSSRAQTGAVADEGGNTFHVYAQWGTASASNTITCEYAYLDDVPGGASD